MDPNLKRNPIHHVLLRNLRIRLLLPTSLISLRVQPGM